MLIIKDSNLLTDIDLEDFPNQINLITHISRTDVSVIKKASIRLKDNQDFALAAIHGNPDAAKYISSELLNSAEFVAKIIEKSPLVI